MLVAGDQIGDWIVEETLGEGGMGSVYRCRNAMSERIKTALKVMKPHNLDSAADRFVREAEALYALRDPAIVRVMGFGKDESRELLWMAMELIDGEDLETRIKRGPLLLDEARSAFRQVAKGLQHAHEIGICHRDIKPGNLMLTQNGRAVVLDFGIAIDEGRTKLTAQGTLPGTLSY